MFKNKNKLMNDKLLKLCNKLIQYYKSEKIIILFGIEFKIIRYFTETETEDGITYNRNFILESKDGISLSIFIEETTSNIFSHFF